MTAAHAPLRLTSCRGKCEAAVLHPAHHDRLLAVDVDPEALLELLEIAVTWHELDYSEADLVGPSAWLSFADAHAWAVPDRASRALSLAVDIVGLRGDRPAAEPRLARVIDLVRG